MTDADIVILQAPYEHTASSRKGTKFGPEKIIECLETKLEFFDRDYKVEPNAIIKVAKSEAINMDAMTPNEALEHVMGISKSVISEGKFPLLFGGEHSVSLGLLTALSVKYDPHDVTILQIDAHCDLRSDDGDYSDEPSNLAHSCVLRRAHELGYRLVQAGIRTYSKEEYEYFSDPKNDIRTFEWGVKKHELNTILDAIKTKYLYITIDVDGFDPAYMPGTGTPVQGGLEWWYGLNLIKSAVDKHELIGADIVEVSPMTESVLTEYGAAQIAYDMISHKFASRIKEATQLVS